MIIPIRCFTCNKVLASLYKEYLRLNEINKNQSNNEIIADLEGILSRKDTKNIEIFQKLGIDRYCCRRHLLSHVDLIQKI